MSETIEKYGENSITYTELAFLMGGFGKQKIFENGHKENPLNKTYTEIFKRIGEERVEFVEAFEIWAEDQTDKNRNNVLNEIADIYNFWIFMSGKIAGYTNLERR